MYLLEKAMVPYSSTLAWRIPWMEEPGRLQSMGSLRVGHNWMISLSLFTFRHWRRKWQSTPVFLLGKFQGQRRLAGYSPWGRKRVRLDLATKQQQQHEVTDPKTQPRFSVRFWSHKALGLTQSSVPPSPLSQLDAQPGWVPGTLWTPISSFFKWRS